MQTAKQQRTSSIDDRQHRTSQTLTHWNTRIIVIYNNTQEYVQMRDQVKKPYELFDIDNSHVLVANCVYLLLDFVSTCNTYFV